MVSTVHGRGLSLFYEYVGWLICWLSLAFLSFCFFFVALGEASFVYCRCTYEAPPVLAWSNMISSLGLSKKKNVCLNFSIICLNSFCFQRFSRPILHGLCTLGFAVRAIIRCICRGDPNMVKNVQARFLLHVYPGETLITEMWLQGLR